MKCLNLWKIWVLAACVSLTGCDAEQEWLNVKRNVNDVMPATLSDFQAILDNNLVMNEGYPMLAMVSTDNLYLLDNIVPSVSTAERNAYLFAADIFEGDNHGDFFNPYIKVAYANIVLDGLKSHDATEGEYKNIRGQALFVRALSFYYLAQTYSLPFNNQTAASELGIQIRQTTDPQENTPRSSILETYERITSDLEEATILLPERSLYKSRASKAAAYGLLAKVYLSMGDVEKAEDRVSKALAISEKILDFNSEKVNRLGGFPFPAYSGEDSNEEVIFYAENLGYATLWPAAPAHSVDSMLYRSYEEGDLRKELFYESELQSRVRFVGSYTGSMYNFAGLATNELLLIKAECLARRGEWKEGLSQLNRLLVNRFRTGTFVPIETDNQEEALAIILSERRKELPFTGLVRWEDLRRLNQDARFATTVTRVYRGEEYELPPGSPRYAFPIPDLEIQLGGAEQNVR